MKKLVKKTKTSKDQLRLIYILHLNGKNIKAGAIGVNPDEILIFSGNRMGKLKIMEER